MASKKLVAGLNERQRAFCEEYIIDFNATRAAVIAGYSEKTAESQGSRLLMNVKVSRYIEVLKEQRAERTEVTADMVIQELAKIAFVTVEDFYHPDGTLKEMDQLSDAAKAAVSSYSVRRIKIAKDEFIDVPIMKTHDKGKALELLGRHVGAFEKDNEQKRSDINVLGFNAFYNN